MVFKDERTGKWGYIINCCKSPAMYDTQADACEAYREELRENQATLRDLF